jgi:hypothetical protein
MEITNYIFNIKRIGSLYESYTDLMFSKDKDNNYIVIFKYITTSITLSILDIEDISYGKDNLLSISFRPDKQMETEKFKTKDYEAIIKMFKKIKEKAIQTHHDESNISVKTKNSKTKQKIQKNLLDLF